MNHQPGHIDEEAGDPDAGDAEAELVNTDVDTSYDPDPNPLLKNPERGMYRSRRPEVDGDDAANDDVNDADEDDRDGNDGNDDDVDDDDDDDHTIVSEWLWLGEVCNEPLTWEGIDDPRTSDVLRMYARRLEGARRRDEVGRREPHKKLFRPRYDKFPNGGLVSDGCDRNGVKVFHAPTMERQKNHIDEVAKMLGEYKDVIAFIQAGYLGNWGEWNWAGGPSNDPYTSANAPFLADRSLRKEVIDYVLAAYAAQNIQQHVELRRPVFAKEVLACNPSANVGLHNDCFMTTDDDMGTYANLDPDCDPPIVEDCDPSTVEVCNPSNFADPEAENAKAWAKDRTARFSFGGETCPAGGNERWRQCSNMVDDDGDPATVDDDDPATLHLSYLNAEYAADDDPVPGVLGAVSTWKSGGCYDEIRRRLGFRFEVRQVEYTKTVAAGQEFLVRVVIENTGWAKLHKPREAKLVLRNGTSAPLEYPFSGGSVADWAPGPPTTISVSDSAPPGTYSVRLWIPDPDTENLDGEVQKNYAVKLATLRNGANVFDPDTGENDLGVEITVEAQPVDRDPPVIGGLWSQVWADNVTGLSARIGWWTSELADTQVAYGPSVPPGSTTRLDPTLTYTHSVKLTGLDPRLPQYRFEVRSCDAAGNLATASGGFSPPP
jgi:hypothetical protein